MKRVGLTLLASLLLVSGTFAQRSIVVTNSTGTDRKAEMVEVIVCKLKADFKKNQYILKNELNTEVPYQLVYNNKKTAQTLIFQANVKANGTSIYTLTKGNPAPVKAKTSARFVPERKDDFAWENDLAAYRMYGPALAKENPSNGVDLWIKCTDEPIVDKFYGDELKHEISYHVDHGLGLDCYKVGHTLGCGGIAPYASDSLWVGIQYSTYKVLEAGPLRSVFMLCYDSVKVGKSVYKEEITITTTAGSMLNKGVVKFKGPSQKMELAAGIYLHEVAGNLKLNADNGTAGFAEPAVSDAKVPEGRNYIGVVIPTKVNTARKKGEHALLLRDRKSVV